MNTCILAAYLLPGETELDLVRVEMRTAEFIASRHWICPDVWPVCQSSAEGEGEVGINLLLPEPLKEPDGWFADVEELVHFAERLRDETGRDAVICIAEVGSSGEDILVIDGTAVDMKYLRAFIGTGESELEKVS